MPRRQHEDSQYDQYEGRFEGREDQSWRDQSNRGSRDWDRRADEFRSEGREGYEGGQRRFEPEYRGGGRYEQRYGGFSQPQSYAGASQPQNWFEERREAQRFTPRDWGRQGPYAQQAGPYAQQSGYSSGYGAQQGGYGQEWNRQGSGQQGEHAGPAGSTGWERSPGYGQRGEFGGARGEFGGYRYDRPDYSREQSNYGARDQYEPLGREREWRGEARGREESWTDQVRHTGHQFATRVKRAFRGPKGYKRSDERIREDVSERLAQQDELDPSDLEVRVANGEVTLTGTVRSRHEKFLAEEIADEVLGVNDVHVQVRVRREQEQNPASAGTNATNQSDVSRNARA